MLKNPSREELMEELRRSWRRLKDVQKRKNDAISEWDLKLGYDWHYYTKGDSPLLRNHVYYFIKKLKELRKENIQINLFG